MPGLVYGLTTLPLAWILRVLFSGAMAPPIARAGRSGSDGGADVGAGKVDSRVAFFKKGVLGHFHHIFPFSFLLQQQNRTRWMFEHPSDSAQDTTTVSLTCQALKNVV